MVGDGRPTIAKCSVADLIENHSLGCLSGWYWNVTEPLGSHADALFNSIERAECRMRMDEGKLEVVSGVSHEEVVGNGHNVVSWDLPCIEDRLKAILIQFCNKNNNNIEHIIF